MLPLDAWPRAATTVARTFGARGGALRAVHEVRRAAGLFRRAPQEAPSRADASLLFRVDAARLRAAVDEQDARTRAERVVGGEYQAYRWDWRALPGTADEWLRNAKTGYEYPHDQPWWKVAHLAATAGDIKDVWEPARFAWVFDLARAFIVTNDARYRDAFTQRLTTWTASSPPFRGVHWSCGQETAIRAIALLYAESNLASSPALTAVLAASGERIDDALGYAISQRNNHAISEAAALIALGVRFRASHPGARRWLARGREWLPRLILEQFAEDGWYAQHSFTYLRLALDQCVVAERALRVIGETLPAPAVERLRAATALLAAVIEPTTGSVPNHGPNDGAFVHPITSTAYGDFRPVMTAVSALWKAPLSSDLAPCVETLAWLGLARPPRGAPLAQGVVHGASGWAAARLGTTQVFLRAGSYTSRPGHVDPLHVDVRFGARQVIVDPGTFAYNAASPWRNALVGARVHNGPIVDDVEPGVRGPRFLWYAWPRADLVRTANAHDEIVITAELTGMARRTVHVTAGRVRIEDRLLQDSARSMSVCWLLHPGATESAVTVSAVAERICAKEDDVRGWYSPLYGLRLPSRALVARVSATSDASIVTTIESPNHA